MDTELFELCKEVYERLEWEIEDPTWVVGDENGDLFILTKEIEDQGHFDYYSPIYTSDYLLEKLPNPSLHKLSDQWRGFGGENDTVATRSGDTPLKALLKLTIALHDAGQLS